jgi:AAA ATPase domain
LMDAHFPVRRGVAELKGRQVECEVLDRLIEAVRQGESRALVLRGEPGVGKTALLDYLAEHASGCVVARAAGVQSEMELAFAGLQQLCAPMLDHLQRLPHPQRDALGVALGIGSGPAPDRFLVALAVLSLFSEVAQQRPLICLVDDLQWLDRASTQALAFVGRRLQAESIGVVLAVSRPGDEVADLPQLMLEGLREDDAHALLDSVLAGPLDARVRDRFVAETRGNPLALLVLPLGLTPAQLGGGFGFTGFEPLSGRIEQAFQRRVETLPAQTRRLLLVAAAEPAGEPLLVWRAAERLGIGTAAATAAVEAGLLGFGTRVLFRHPLVRSAVYRSAPLEQRREVHRALAEVTDPERDPERRAWHRAQAAPGPDDDVAAELERSAGERPRKAEGMPAYRTPGPRWVGRRGGVSGTRRDADPRTRSPCRSPAGRRQDEMRRRRARRRAGAAGSGRGRTAGRASDRRGGAPARADRDGAGPWRRCCSTAAQRRQAS